LRYFDFDHSEPFTKMTNFTAGRICPIAYRYGAEAIAAAPVIDAETLYVVGGLYGNHFALQTVLDMAAAEHSTVTICFNGDFNWFNVDEHGFKHINDVVLKHDALLGNVEYEFRNEDVLAGCGCAYPESVAQEIVENSNQIHVQLKTTARNYPQVLEKLEGLPLFKRYRIDEQIITTVHGDADSLAGWAFDAAALKDPTNAQSIHQNFKRAQTDIFASTHTCLPMLRQFHLPTPRQYGCVINNGAAGMPNFKNTSFGLLTRISRHPSPHTPVYGTKQRSLLIDAVPIDYDADQWRQHFISIWPEGTAAHRSYFARIMNGPDFLPMDAAP
jgi:hypothetical protein